MNRIDLPQLFIVPLNLTHLTCFLCPPIESYFVSFRIRKCSMWWNAHCRFAVTLSVGTSTFIAPVICSHCVLIYAFFLSLFFTKKKEVFSFFCLFFAFFFLILFVLGAVFNDTDFEFKTKIELDKIKLFEEKIIKKFKIKWDFCNL